MKTNMTQMKTDEGICIYLNGTGGFCGQIFLLICMLALCPANCSLPTLPALSPRLRENVRLYLGLFSCCCSLETLSRKFPQPGCQRVWRERLRLLALPGLLLSPAYLQCTCWSQVSMCA
ncbi:uncharacterized protein LOC144314205 isoform X3 [Canis aureus]